MPARLCVTVRFLMAACHGRDERGEPEWPPSPLRLFQALVAASAARWNERTRLETAAEALRWLERQPPPEIVAPTGRPAGSKYRLYVPDNVGDKVAASWSRGREASIADYRTEKDVRPTLLEDGAEAVHYLWTVAESDAGRYANLLRLAARSITHLGWGVDMVAADAEILSEEGVKALAGERWRPSESEGTSLRVPAEGTLHALSCRHAAFLERIGEDGFRPVPPLTAFRVCGYRRATDPPRRSFAAFSLLKPDASGFRPFDTVRLGTTVAGMLRHAAGSPDVAAGLGWPPEKVAGFVLGHGEPAGQPHAPVRGPRLAYIPLPSIEARAGRTEVVGAIRRVLVAVYNGEARDDLMGIARLLSGADLVGSLDAVPTALLSRLPDSDGMVRRYTRPASTWATVTPVVLPGFDDPRKVRERLSRTPEPDDQADHSERRKRRLDRLDRRIEDLLRKAIRQSGFSEELARLARIEWRPVGFWPGTEHAHRYEVPANLRRFRRLHVRIGWCDGSGGPIPVHGPLCLGGGRYYGLGLFAPVD